MYFQTVPNFNSLIFSFVKRLKFDAITLGNLSLENKYLPLKIIPKFFWLKEKISYTFTTEWTLIMEILLHWSICKTSLFHFNSGRYRKWHLYQNINHRNHRKWSLLKCQKTHFVFKRIGIENCYQFVTGSLKMVTLNAFNQVLHKDGVQLRKFSTHKQIF